MAASAPARPMRARDLLAAYLGPQWPRAAVLAALLLGGIGLELANPQILRAFIDGTTGGAELSALVGLALLFLGVALAIQLVSVAENYVAQDVGLTATNRLRADLALHCLRLDPAFHSAHTPGELIERVDGDVATLGNFFSRFVVHLLGNALLLVGILALVFQVDWRAGAALAAFAAVTLVVLNALREVAVPRWAAARQASAELFGFLEERLAGAEDLRASGATAYAMRRLFERMRILFRLQLRAAVLGTASFASTELLLMVGVAVALGAGAYLFQAGAISLGTVYLLFSYTWLLNRPVQQISRQMQDLQQADASLSRVRALLGERSAVQDPAGEPSELPPGPLAVEFAAVSFAYGPDEPVLRDVSFRVAPGEVLGLLGRTGSGKTTIARLLFRLYDPRAGAVRLGGVELRAARLADLRRRVGMVTQDVQLFHASLRDNLALFDRAISDERIVAALAELGLWEWYRSLPGGLDTRLAPGGGGLSAGEAQLLAFARVFLKDPGLVVLDEASSRLDPATERRLEQAIDRLLAGRTAIVIDHRLATLERADTVLVLEGGRVLEYGPRRQLAADPASRLHHLLAVGLEGVTA